MKKIFISDNEKLIIRTLASNGCDSLEREYFNLSIDNFNRAVRSLQAKNIVVGLYETNEVGFLACRLTNLGIAYLEFNPMLENPKTEEELAQEARKSKIRDLIFDFIKILFGAAVGAAATYLFG